MSYSQSTPYLPIRRLTGEHKEPITCLAFSATGDYLASASEDGVLVIWNIANGAQVASIQFENPVLSLAWDSQHQARLFVGCSDGIAAYIDNYQVLSCFPSRIRLPLTFLQGPLIPILIDQLQTAVYAIAVSRRPSRLCHIALAAGQDVFLSAAHDSGEFVCLLNLEFTLD